MDQEERELKIWAAQNQSPHGIEGQNRKKRKKEERSSPVNALSQSQSRSGSDPIASRGSGAQETGSSSFSPKI